MLRTELARPENIPAIMDLISQAKEYLREQGVDQWQGGYPDEAAIREDIVRESGYLLWAEGRTAGYLCISFDGEPCYAGLKGRWRTPEPYAVMHRMALDRSFRGRGLAVEGFRLAERLCRQRGVEGIRVDTDAANGIMRHILGKNGFIYCGTIWFQNSEKIAFDKLVPEA